MQINGYDIKPLADLRGANLRGANLREADLWRANLREADLREADLREANLLEANLRGADLRGANLREADLWRANLRGANLREANLRGANLDYSQINLMCAGTNFKICDKLAKQIMLHALELSYDHFPGGLTKEQVEWLMGGHRASEECFQEFFRKANRGKQ